MKRRPKGRKYRNLHERDGVIYYQRSTGSRRVRFSTKTSDWAAAAAVRDLFEESTGDAKPTFLPEKEVPTFAEFSKRYLEERTSTLARTTLTDRTRELAEGGPILRHFGPIPIDEISKAHLEEWWTIEIVRAGRATKTGLNLLGAVSKVFRYAKRLSLIETNPTVGFRAGLHEEHGGTQSSRAASDTESQNIRPIEHPARLIGLLDAIAGEDARHESGRGRPRLVSAADLRVFVLLMLDGGLRSGEAMAPRWKCIRWAQHPDDRGRSLLVDRSRSRGGALGPTKSGRSRTVALSRRLQDALFELYKESRPDGDDLVLPQTGAALDAAWRRLVKRAGIGPIRQKDLRDTFASQLLTCGIQLAYVSKQIGHRNAQVTVTHYAKWCEGDDYREPLRLEEGEVPADLLSRLPEKIAPTIAPTLRIATPREPGAEATDDKTHSGSGSLWCPGLDSNQHPHYTDQALNLACLPIPPPGHSVGSQS